jgi:DNA-binding NtrC family response regulator
MNAHNRVMFVDDEEGVRMSWDRMLTEHGFQVTTATDGRRAISELKEHPTDVVVADWKMPVMDGLELLEWVKTQQPGTRFILLTGYGDAEVERKARELGAYEYLNKPISPDALAAIVSAAANVQPVEPVPVAEQEPKLELVEEEATEAVAVEEDQVSKSGLRTTLEIAGGLVLAPILRLAFVIALPVVGFFAFSWYVAQIILRGVRPAGSNA